jgi:hypothetical protein
MQQLSLDLPDAFAQALADSHPSGDLHEAAAHALQSYLDPTMTNKPRDEAIRAAVLAGTPRPEVAKKYRLSLIRVHQIMAKHQKRNLTEP